MFQVAELARRQRDRGLRLNAPEAIAIACDEMHMAARAGGTFDEVVAAGMPPWRPRTSWTVWPRLSARSAWRCSSRRERD